jgi:uncharacterized protein YhfF
MTLEEAMAKYPRAQTYQMGDSAALTDMLLGLVRAGRKRATCTAVIDVEQGREEMPVLGRRDIALTHDGRPALVTETRELRHVRFCNMTAEMALAEGEDDSLESWQDGHRRYYTRQGIFVPDMLLIWERFEVIEDFGA